MSPGGWLHEPIDPNRPIAPDWSSLTRLGFWTCDRFRSP